MHHIQYEIGQRWVLVCQISGLIIRDNQYESVSQWDNQYESVSQWV